MAVRAQHLDAVPAQRIVGAQQHRVRIGRGRRTTASRSANGNFSVLRNSSAPHARHSFPPAGSVSVYSPVTRSVPASRSTAYSCGLSLVRHCCGVSVILGAGSEVWERMRTSVVSLRPVALSGHDRSLTASPRVSPQRTGLRRGLCFRDGLRTSPGRQRRPRRRTVGRALPRAAGRPPDPELGGAPRAAPPGTGCRAHRTSRYSSSPHPKVTRRYSRSRPRLCQSRPFVDVVNPKIASQAGQLRTPNWGAPPSSGTGRAPSSSICWPSPLIRNSGVSRTPRRWCR